MALDDIIDRVFSFARSLRASSPPPPLAPAAQAEEPIRTRTMARLLASQGEHARAAAIYDALCAEAPGDAELAREAAAARAATPAPAAPPPAPAQAAAPGVSARAVDDQTVHVCWALEAEALREAAGQALEEGAELVARLLLIAPDEAALVREELRERRVEREGEWLVSGLPEGAHFVAVLGLRWGAGFISVAHAAPGRLHKKG